jgi:hypothetical protein
MMGRKDNEEKVFAKKEGGGLRRQQINADVDWKLYLKHLEKTPRDLLVKKMSSLLLQVESTVSADVIRQYADESARDSFIRSATIQIMSTPEYQLC